MTGNDLLSTGILHDLALQGNSCQLDETYLNCKIVKPLYRNCIMFVAKFCFCNWMSDELNSSDD